jgi:hypothetical protein
MKTLKISSLALGLLINLLVVSLVLAQTGGGYDLTWWTIDGGGGAASGGGFTLGGTVGQPEPGPVLTGGDFSLYSGFWTAGGAASSTCPAPLLGVDIVGPSSGYTGSQYSFTAQPDPVTPTLPITFTWSTDGLISGQGAAMAVYSWTITGSHAISLTAANCGGAISADHTINLTDPPTGCDFPLTDFEIDGPTTGETDQNLTFTSRITPTNATTPITYTWSSNGLVSGQGSNTAVYNWSTSGQYQIVASAANCGGAINDSHQIVIAPKYRVYLPLVIK